MHCLFVAVAQRTFISLLYNGRVQILTIGMFLIIINRDSDLLLPRPSNAIAQSQLSLSTACADAVNAPILGHRNLFRIDRREDSR